METGGKKNWVKGEKVEKRGGKEEKGRKKGGKRRKRGKVLNIGETS